MEQQKKTPAVRFRGFDEEWEIVPLGENCPIIMGQSPSSLNYTQNREDDILIQGNADIENGVIVPRVWTTEITKQAKKGDIIMTVRAPVGDIAITDYNAVIGRGVVSIKGNKFIYYNLNKKKLESFWTSISSGSTFESITASDVKSTIIKLPKSKPEQTKIGFFFETIDQLLSKHQTQHQKLQALKKAMLGKLFPKQGATVPEIRFKGFTGEWEEIQLHKLTNYQNGKGYEAEQRKSGKYELINLNAISIEGGLKSSGKYIEKANETLIVNDLVMILSDVGYGNLLGRVALIPENNKYVLNQRVALLRPNDSVEPIFLFYNINQHQEYFKSEGTGMSQLNLSKSSVENFKSYYPLDKKEQQQIGQYFKNLDALISKHATQIEKLGHVKKACLSKMFV